MYHLVFDFDIFFNVVFVFLIQFDNLYLINSVSLVPKSNIINFLVFNLNFKIDLMEINY